MAPTTESEEEIKPFLSQGLDITEPCYTCACTKRSRSRRLAARYLPWMLSVVSWLVVVYLLFENHYIQAQVADTLKDTTGTLPLPPNQIPEKGYFSTDLEDARSSIQYETRVFTGGLSYNETTKRFYRDINMDEPQYFGLPSAEIDETWETNVFKYEWTNMADDEIQPFLGSPEIRKFGGTYLFETDMLHSLHCLNEVRKHVDKDYYKKPDDKSPIQDDWDRIHIDHCLDQLRQTIICFGDLSPVVLHSWKGVSLALGQGTAHTCRKWDPINEWNLRRHNATKHS